LPELPKKEERKMQDSGPSRTGGSCYNVDLINSALNTSVDRPSPSPYLSFAQFLHAYLRAAAVFQKTENLQLETNSQRSQRESPEPTWRWEKSDGQCLVGSGPKLNRWVLRLCSLTP
jgi:hypothetical protein